MKSHAYIALVALLAAACSPKRPSPLQEPPPALVLQGVGLKVFRGDRLHSVGRSRSATYEREKGDITASALTLRMLDAQEDGDVELKATEAAGNLKLQLAEASGGVKLTDAKGMVTSTRRGRLDGAHHRAEGVDPVQVTGPGYRLDSRDGFTLSFGEQTVLSLIGPVDTRIHGAP